jgi:Domain of unknown function (DUF4170)
MREKEHGESPQVLHQVLHLVFGGELTAVDKIEFSDVGAIDIVGIFPDYASAYDAWKDVSHRNIDNALIRYFIVDLQTLLEPKDDAEG